MAVSMQSAVGQNLARGTRRSEVLRCKVLERRGWTEAPRRRGVSGRYRSMTASMSGSIRGGGDASEMPKNRVIESSSATNPPLMP